jgi:Rrf2 family protein
MKFSAQEEYGLRCLLQIGKNGSANGLTIPEISRLENLSQANVGKLLRILRLGGLIEAERGQSGGYRLARPAEEISVNEILHILGGKLFDTSFCDDHSGAETICNNSIDCSIRSLWKTIQSTVDKVLGEITLKDLIGNEREFEFYLISKFDEQPGN